MQKRIIAAAVSLTLIGAGTFAATTTNTFNKPISDHPGQSVTVTQDPADATTPGETPTDPAAGGTTAPTDGSAPSGSPTPTTSADPGTSPDPAPEPPAPAPITKIASTYYCRVIPVSKTTPSDPETRNDQFRDDEYSDGHVETVDLGPAGRVCITS